MYVLTFDVLSHRFWSVNRCPRLRLASVAAYNSSHQTKTTLASSACATTVASDFRKTQKFRFLFSKMSNYRNAGSATTTIEIRGECFKMPTLRKIVIFFSVNCNRSTYLYSMQRLIIIVYQLEQSDSLTK